MRSVKRPLVLLAAGLALVLGACAAPTAEQPPTAPRRRSLRPPRRLSSGGGPPIPDWMADQPVPAFLDAEQQALFLRAYSAASFLMGCSTSGVDSYPLDGGDPPELGDYETVTLDSGWTYLVAQGGTPGGGLPGHAGRHLHPGVPGEAAVDGEYGLGAIPHLHRRWGGRTCFLELERGSSLEYGWADVPDTYELVSQSEDAVEFYLVGHYADLTVQPDETGARPLSTERWPIRMERTADGWRVSEFHVPY